jgi:hypothetical protein
MRGAKHDSGSTRHHAGNRLHVHMARFRVKGQDRRTPMPRNEADIFKQNEPLE